MRAEDEPVEQHEVRALVRVRGRVRVRVRVRVSVRVRVRVLAVLEQQGLPVARLGGGAHQSADPRLQALDLLRVGVRVGVRLA